MNPYLALLNLNVLNLNSINKNERYGKNGDIDLEGH